MKKIILTTAIVLLIVNFTIGQKWTYTSGGNEFDGKYKTASIRGKGGKFPYNSPLFVVNYFDKDNKLNVYFNDVGYAGCDDKYVYLKFDGSDEIYMFYVTSNLNKDAWFLWLKKDGSKNYLSILELLDKLKTNNTMYVRLKSLCGQKDYEFSLSGSSTAINFVTNDYFIKMNQIQIAEKENEARKLKEEQEKKELRSRNLVLLNSGRKFETKVLYLSSLYYLQEPFKYYPESINKDEKIIISNYSDSSDFCRIIKAASFDIPIDTILYIKKDCIDILDIETVNLDLLK